MSMTIHSGAVPYLTTAQMVEVDRAMMQDYHIELLQMMENAGRNLAHLGRVRFLNGDPRGRRITVLVGTGGNGGGALVAARRLASWGAVVRVITARPEAEFTAVPAHQLRILQRMQVPIFASDAVAQATPVDLILDGLIGYSLQGAPHGTTADLIRWANSQGAPILALDVPSGIDTASGTVYDPVIRATATMTLALPKEGLREPKALPLVGELYLADISVPPGLYIEPGLGLMVGPLFARDEVIRLR